ncbi:DUF309 domain-containing protein [Kitasatospora sp. NPDC088346]|uniref:DUF309 domain-containing protein n=1 Tax=Kitasatospora sp. NPDC088346 TaxID=3364073 RepID=UPI003804E0A4
MSESVGDGGDPACWLERVCDACGRPRERPGPGACEFCGAVVPVAAPPRRGGRDRDADGRARNGRPRDGLGRPLPYGRQGVMRQPEGVVRSGEQTVTEAQRLLDAGRPFHAHEVLEDRWKSGPDAERALWRGLAQFAVGLTHAARGNPVGARALLARAADGLAPYGEARPYGVDLSAVVRWARERSAAADILDAPDVPRLTASRS